MPAARIVALLALSLLAASCAKKAESPAAGGDGAGSPSGSAPSGFIPDRLRGDWKVYSHRVIGETTVTEDEAIAMRGRPVAFTLEFVAFGADTCRNPRYSSAMLRADSLLTADYGATPSHFGFVGGATAITTRTEVLCDEKRWESPASLVLDMPDGRVYLLWNGTFFQLERR